MPNLIVEASVQTYFPAFEVGKRLAAPPSLACVLSLLSASEGGSILTPNRLTPPLIQIFFLEKQNAKHTSPAKAEEVEGPSFDSDVFEYITAAYEEGLALGRSEGFSEGLEAAHIMADDKPAEDLAYANKGEPE